jgi:aryl-alcohol dehydrogenase-like predicted oxidoreductase
MTWGTDTGMEDARAQLHALLDGGGTLVDTADCYGDGAAEEVLGDLLSDDVDRSELVITTKAGQGQTGITASGAPRPDASARTMLTSLDRSLRRLGTDHVDLWLVHAWDPAVPVEETLRALQAAVSTGRARYVGVADHRGWQLATAAAVAQHLGVPLIAAAQEVSLLQRSADAEVLPAAAHHGVGVIAWAPLGRGVLTGKYLSKVPPGSRGASERLAGWVAPYLDDSHRRVVQAVVTAADGLGVPPLQVALAWARDVPGVASCVVGARTADQLREALAADDLELPAEIRAALDDVSVRATSG